DTAELEEGWTAMAQLQQEGKVRWIGVSNFNVEQMQLAQSIAPITSLQPPYSLIRRDVEEEILPFCHLEEIGVIVYSPMASGLLTGAMTLERISKLPDDDWRKHHPVYNDQKPSAPLPLGGGFRAFCKRHACFPGAVGVPGPSRHPAVTAALVGARNPEQVDDVVAGGGIRLTQSALKEI